ncbi:ankyrin repeat-containing protein [Legionella gratiana]|uniref:Ankyrin repeat-containing protein n=1 Tax=Legionella gratiana TaxID=45066 RepID=A0A378JC56_9GAMM|nr:YopT-type cysteine protease domain-containing protein [Legionella gratiana]KTD06377.1 ankyrin repeat-containing protein [Legionella gratiana]STX45195.1 ankyrin repeat-containing protein [Legionella gratiana]
MNLSQAQIIQNINQYLELNNLPYELDEEGICNGLATVYAKYVLEEKEEKFIELLEYVSGNKETPKNEVSRINKFLIDVILSFMPEEFNKSLNQSQSYLMQFIDKKPLKSTFELALLTEDENWNKVIADIDLQRDEVMLVCSKSHAIAISKKNEQYFVYDPNYINGPKSFTHINNIVKELHKNVFQCKSQMCLRINILLNPIKESHRRKPYPKVEEIYDKYLNKKDPSKRYLLEESEISTIEMASCFNNTEVMKKLISLEKNKENIIKAALIAANMNSTKSLTPLLPILDNRQLGKVLFVALLCGRKDVFDLILQTENGTKIYNFFSEYAYFRSKLLGYAAEGGNVLLLQQIMASFEKSVEKKMLVNDILTLHNGNDAITRAIIGKDPACLRLLLEKVDGNDELSNLDNEAKRHYLLLAIEYNQPQIVKVLIDRMPTHLLDTLSLDLTLLEKTNLSILKNLKEKGIVFSMQAEEIVARKEHHPVGFMYSMGVVSTRFVDYFKEYILQMGKNTTSFDHEKFLYYKKAFKLERNKAQVDYEALQITYKDSSYRA